MEHFAPRQTEIWFWVVSSAGRATRLHRVGRGFEPLTTHHFPPLSSHHQAVARGRTRVPCAGPVRLPTGAGIDRGSAAPAMCQRGGNFFFRCGKGLTRGMLEAFLQWSYRLTHLYQDDCGDTETQKLECCNFRRCDRRWGSI